MKTLKINCPSCNLSIEVNREQSHVGIKCPNCGDGLIPDNVRHGDKIERQADLLVALSMIVFLIGVPGLFAGDWGVWCIGISFLLYLAGQVVHIRALLAKK